MTASNTPKTIDVRSYSCPMSSVQTRVQIDQMTSGEEALICMKGETARENIGTILKMLGYITLEQRTIGADEWQVKVLKP